MMEQLERTKENWTYGIINIPLLFGHDNRNGVNPRSILRKVAHNAKCYGKPFPCLNKNYRYLFFELDTADSNQHLQVLEYMQEKGLGVYWHRTSKGFHYITVELFTVEEYDTEMDYLKSKFDNMTFSYSLRVIPNKWINEKGVWYMGSIVNNGDNNANIQLLHYIANAFNKPYIFNYNRTKPQTVEMLENVFCISRYEFKKGLQV